VFSAEMKKIGIIICDRYSTCAGGKCLRALRNREGAFAVYGKEQIELVGYTTCGGCPGGNIEYAPEEMKKNGAEIVHLATGLVVGYPPCPWLKYFSSLIPQKFGMKTVIGTHPIPEKYLAIHRKLGTWKSKKDQAVIQHVLADEKMRLAYD
jgi:predicted metal-binding protein